MRITFWGTSEFALPSLQALVNHNYTVVAVYTKDIPIKKKTFHPIAKFAKDNSISLRQPTNLNTNEEFEKFLSLRANIGIVVSYGMIIPKCYLQSVKYGFINVHPSDLPRWRGPSPIYRTIIAGDVKSAVCIIKMTSTIDAGAILIKQLISLSNDVTGVELRNITSNIGATLVIQALKLFLSNKVKYEKQNTNKITYANKITPLEKKLNFFLTSDEVNNFIRAFSIVPGAYLIYKNKMIKIMKARVINTIHKYEPGTIVDGNFSISCKKGLLRPIIVQKSGKKMMSIKSFLNGFTFIIGSKVI